MGCEENDARLSALVDGEVSEAEERKLAGHMAACPRCAARFETLDRAAGLVSLLEDVRPSRDFLARLDERLAQEEAVAPPLPHNGSRRLLRSRSPSGVPGTLLRLAAAGVLFAAAGYLVRETLTDRTPGEGRSVARPDLPTRTSPGALAVEVGIPLPPPPKPDREAGSATAGASLAEPAPLPLPAPSGSAVAEGAAPAVPSAAPVTEEEALAAAIAAEAADEPTGPAPDRDPAQAKEARARARERTLRAEKLASAFLSPRLSHEERKAALHELVALGGRPAARVLEEVLVRRPGRYGSLGDEALAAVAVFPSRETVAVLAEAARLRPEGVLTALFDMTDAAILRHCATELLPTLDERTHPDARLIFAEALAARQVREAAAPIAKALGETRDAQAKVRLCLALGRLEDPAGAEALTAALADRHPAVRTAAARALAFLAEQGAPAARDALLLALADPQPEVRVGAAASLGGATDAATQEALLRLSGKDARAAVRGQALFSLQRRSGQGLYDEAAFRRYFAEAAPGARALPRGMIALTKEVPNGDLFGIPVRSEGVVFLVDVSASMAQGERLTVALRELARTLVAMPEGTTFQVACFSDVVQMAFREPRRKSAKAVEEALRFVEARGATQGGPTDVLTALARVLEQPDVDQIFLLSDGGLAEDTRAARERLRLRARMLLWQGEVRVHAISLAAGSGSLRVDPLTGPATAPVLALRALVLEGGGVMLRDD